MSVYNYTSLYLRDCKRQCDAFIMVCNHSQASQDIKNSRPRSPDLRVHLDISTSTIAHRSSRLASCHRGYDGRTVSLALEVSQDPHPVVTMERKKGFHDTRDGEWVVFLSVRGEEVLTGCRRPVNMQCRVHQESI